MVLLLDNAQLREMRRVMVSRLASKGVVVGALLVAREDVAKLGEGPVLRSP